MSYYRWRRRYRRQPGLRGAAAAAAAGLVLAAAAHAGARPHHGRPPAGDHAGGAAPRAARVAISWAERQLGCPYTWGGTGPCDSGFDCSGLVMQAWARAGVHLARTSQQQWATLPHIRRSQLRPGDLVFKAGADGTVESPGHVVMYLGHGKVIQAYATGTPVEISPLASVTASGLTGYARP
jgi:cell wall-associated NlpC family hydrolase